jgi:hypothetical protein
LSVQRGSSRDTGESNTEGKDLHREILLIKSTSSSGVFDLLLFDFPFLPLGGSSPNSTLALAGRFLTAEAQSVGAGC